MAAWTTLGRCRCRTLARKRIASGKRGRIDYLEIAALSSVPTAVWFLYACRFVERRGGPQLRWKATLLLLGVIAAYVPTVILLENQLPLMWRYWVNSPPAFIQLALAYGVMPAALFGLAVYIHLRRAGPALIVALAGTIAVSAALTFELLPKGSWQMGAQLEVLLTIGILFLTWHLFAGVGIWWWAARARWLRPGQCHRCGYDLSGLKDTPTCPECGAESPEAKPNV